MSDTNLAVIEQIEINPPQPPEPRKPYLCRHIFVDGRQCGSRALRSQNFCYYHYAHRTPLLLGRRNRQPSSGFELTQLDGLDNHTSIQLTISQVLGRVADNTIDPKRAWLLLFGLQIAGNNLRNVQKTGPTAGSSIPEAIIEDADHGQLAELESGRTAPPSLLDRMQQALLEDPDADLSLFEVQT